MNITQCVGCATCQQVCGTVNKFPALLLSTAGSVNARCADDALCASPDLRCVVFPDTPEHYCSKYISFSVYFLSFFEFEVCEFQGRPYGVLMNVFFKCCDIYHLHKFTEDTLFS